MTTKPAVTQYANPKEIAAFSSSNWKIEQPFALVPREAKFDKGLSGRRFKVLLVLIEHANEKGHCWPTQQTIGRILGIDRRDVANLIGDLVDLGWVEIPGVFKVPGSRHPSNFYQLKLPDAFAARAAKIYRGGRDE